MPRYRVTVRVEEYWDYICEEENETDARLDAINIWKETVGNLLPYIDVEPADDDTPLGDVG